jgi:hypothetical protein
VPDEEEMSLEELGEKISRLLLSFSESLEIFNEGIKILEELRTE